MKKSIRKLSSVAHKLPRTKHFRLVSRYYPHDPNLVSAGLSGMSIGESRLPGAIGRITNFNANGRSIKLKHLPKEERFTHSILMHFRPWGRGAYQSMIVDHYRDCYPIKEVPPPATELSLIEENGNLYLCTPTLHVASNSEEEIVHVVNMLLETSGHFHVATDDGFIEEREYIKMNWKFIPPGEPVHDYVKRNLEASATPENRQYVIVERQNFINGFIPDKVYVGLGGFSDYLAYEFTERNLVILESIKFGNAIYVFNKNWEEFSKMTKRELIMHNLATRIVHTLGWKGQVNNLLR
jgi:hypothetical protein